jgi:hypothetical protein
MNQRSQKLLSTLIHPSDVTGFANEDLLPSLHKLLVGSKPVDQFH